MRFHLTPLGIGALLIVVFVAVSIVVVSHTGFGSPVATVEPNMKRIFAKDGEKKIITTYEVYNTGGGILTLGDVTTSCGCTVASVSSKKLAHGEKSIVTVEGIPPEAGSKLVSLDIETNSRSKRIHCTLTMVGARKPPFLVSTSGPISFVMTSNTEIRDAIIINTEEFDHEQPWITRFEVLPEIGNLTQMKIGNIPMREGIVSRRYECKLILNEAKLGTNVDAVMHGFHGDQLVTSIPIHGVRLPAVGAAPSILYASLESEEEPVKFSVAIQSFRQDKPLVVKMETPLPLGIFVKLAMSANDRTLYNIEVNPKEFKGGKYILRFATNNMEIKQVLVPLMIQRKAD